MNCVSARCTFRAADSWLVCALRVYDASLLEEPAGYGAEKLNRHLENIVETEK
jgi:hypothetical protein